MLPRIHTGKEIWDAVKETHSKVHDDARIYDIETQISEVKQRAQPVTEYSFFSGLWQELESYQCIEMVGKMM